MGGPFRRPESWQRLPQSQYQEWERVRVVPLEVDRKSFGARETAQPRTARDERPDIVRCIALRPIVLVVLGGAAPIGALVLTPRAVAVEASGIGAFLR